MRANAGNVTFVMMMSKLSLFRGANSLPFPLLSSSYSSRFIHKPPKTLLILCSFSTNLTSLPYGPSLLRGKKKKPPLLLSDLSLASTRRDRDARRRKIGDFEEPDALLDEDEFTRVFEVSAVRVPAKDCFALENRLRGHLLNWPRIRNIARVPGDEIDEDVVKLLGRASDEEEEEDSVVDSVDRRIRGKAEGDGERLSPVLHRDQLARTFNSTGYLKFRNLAKISRPKRKRRTERTEGKEKVNKGSSRNEFAVVEVVEDQGGGDGDFEGLLGEGYGSCRGRWRGSTRLLLLDERYSGEEVQDLPEAIKVLFEEAKKTDASLSFELVRCRLTLFYDYWPMNEVLEALLPKGMIVPSAFEMVGHIAHLNLRDEHLPYKRLIAKVVLDKNQPKIQTVVNKIDPIHNDFRTMQLEVLAGNHSLVTMVVENGLRFHVDLARVYWNSKLGTERQRLLLGFDHNDVVCDVFAGVGPIALAAARIVKRVYANDLNPHAVEFMEQNSVVNKLEKRIEVFNMDGRRFIKAMFSSDKGQKVTQVVMNLPKDAAESLDAFCGVYNDRHRDEGLSFPTIHVYGFSKAADPEFDFHERIRIALSEVAVDVKMRKVRLVAPGKWMLCASFVLPKSVAFSRKAINDVD
ncbi:tRNA (guanine(37)-N1)-methyltransferase 2 [Raphanus sativus]|uniref:tRNA (guanine(37)-N1)-methyltransferase n=1 Tax=Raphanus sativus TaxID=3726 RepID=A0A6J0KIZ3_RAPSA|nr:tRNA (guanine(37)-N1)-methyltransferase 2 [Raphanus sativus]KAJ4913328.1 tRNA (guanine(37)-N1)-methyltransferase 2 [Raphanus sativus]